MSFTRHALRVACLAGGAIVAASPASRAAETDSQALPVVAEHKYRVLATVRPFLFWISRDNVGGARITWRGDDAGAFGLDLLIGSDPQRTPRKINRWGYIAEQVRGSEARVLGVMKQSNEHTVAEPESQIAKEAGQGGYAFRVIQGTATGRAARAGVMTVRVTRDLTFRDIGQLLAMVSATGNGVERADTRSVWLPAGTRSGFLLALSDLLTQSVDAHGRAGATFTPSRAPIQFVYSGTFYDLTMKSAELLKAATIDAQQYTDVARSAFEIRNRRNSEKTRFQLTYGTTGALAGIPVHAVYQPRWWFEVQIVLDEASEF